MKKYCWIITFSCTTIAIVLTLLNVFAGFTSLETVNFFARWIALISLVLFGICKRSLTVWIFIAMIIGIEIGHDFPTFAVHLNIFSKIFLKLIKTIVAPLIIGTLIYGIAGHSNIRQVGRMGWKSLLYFEIVTTFAIVVGLFAINFTKAGVGIKVENIQNSDSAYQAVNQSTEDIILHIFPDNIAKSIANGEVLQIVIFSIIFGVALLLINEKKRKKVTDAAEILSDTMFKFTRIVMYFAPFGVAGAMAYTVGHMGIGVLSNLAILLATLYLALVFFIFGILFPIALITKVPIKKFLSAVIEPMSIAFATSTSEAALPIAMQNMEKIGVPRKIVAFVLPTGYSFNLDGTSLYLSLASIFVAQAAGIDLTIGQQIMIVLTLMLTSKGVAAVPRASLIILLGTVSSFGLPSWPIFLILGIDSLMDMARTSVNVLGNCLASVVIAKWEGEFDNKEQTLER